ncbi:MAG TPA: hypothetical protein VL175_01035 [Pirellulales bacterium]|nr:hypothetical protein [Pirellulales bacterium]
MKLIDAIHNQTGEAREHLVLLRHSNARVNKLRQLGGSVDTDYTFIQPRKTRYDYDFHADRLVAVVVDDRLFSVYRVAGIEAEGNSYELGSAAYRQLQIFYRQLNRPAYRFKMERIDIAGIGNPIFGWTSPRSTTLRYDQARRGLFWRIGVA